MSDVIELNGVSKTYRRGSETIQALREVSLAVPAGQFVAMIGPSGSGKSTMLNLIGCVDRADRGTVRVVGKETTQLTDGQLASIRSSEIGFVFQQFFLLPTLTAVENVQLPALFRRNGDKSKRAAELLERVGLGARLHHLPAQLSGGEMQRVAIARALVNGPKLLLADEPTGSLDSESAQTVIGIVRELNADGLTVVLVTHNTELASVADRIVTLRDGQTQPQSGA
jgi:putative ABC transport system ATP-binding protein